MSSSEFISQKDDLHDSWVDVHYQSNGSAERSPKLPSPDTSQCFYPGSLEKLLIEAQKESRSTSRDTSARESPKSPPHSPSSEVTSGTQDERDPGTDWIWDWSSMPNAIPPSSASEFTGKFRHPSQRHNLSVRNTSVMKNSIFRLENLPTLLITHACAFVFGAACVLFIRKFCSWRPVTTPVD